MRQLLISCALLMSTASSAMLFSHDTTHPGGWTDQSKDTVVSYIYGPGLSGSEILMGRYCPRFIASTGEEITCSKGIEVLRFPAESVNFAEIRLKPVKTRTSRAIAGRRERCKRIDQEGEQESQENIFYRIFMAPWRAINHAGTSLVMRYKFGFTVKKSPYKQKNSLEAYSIAVSKINLAQEDDLAIFDAMYKKHTTSVAASHRGSKNYGVVLYGHSRGSAMVFNFTALSKDPAIKAVVCEGIFDSLEHVSRAAPTRRVRAMAKLAPQITKFNSDGIQPITLAERFPCTVPLLLVTSRGDGIVPAECTIELYKKLRATGHDKVHILILEKAGHVMSYAQDDTKDRDLYESVVHAFYRHYNLPYRLACAEKGYEYFIKSTQPHFS